MIRGKMAHRRMIPRMGIIMMCSASRIVDTETVGTPPKTGGLFDFQKPTHAGFIMTGDEAAHLPFSLGACRDGEPQRCLASGLDIHLGADHPHVLSLGRVLCCRVGARLLQVLLPSRHLGVQDHQQVLLVPFSGRVVLDALPDRPLVLGDTHVADGQDDLLPDH